MTMRITGMGGSGLDIDSIVSDSLKPYKLKIQKQEQQKQVLEWKQEQYQAIMKKASTFYNKYLDPTSADSLYSLGAYNQTKFSSDNENVVTVTGSSSASIQNYTVTSVSSLATKATGKILDTTLNTKAAAEVTAGTSYTASTTVAGQTISFSAKVGSANEANNLTNFTTSINTKINDLITAYGTETDTSKKAVMETNIKTLGTTIGKDYTVSGGTWNNTAIAGYTTDNLKATMNNLSVATNTNITASDGTNNVSSKLYVKLNGSVDTSATITNYNKATGATNIVAKYSSISAGIVFEARDAGAKTLTINGVVQDGGAGEGTSGTNLNATIKNAYGDIKTVSGTSNSTTIDGVAFNFKATTASAIEIKGSQDVSGLVTKIKNFVKDYNELIGLVNGKTWEEYDSDYQPLTDDQRESMSDSQIEKWEKKAQTGLLRRDDDIVELSDSMKNVMSTFMMSNKIDLESIGIKPVNDYKELNGTYEVDGEKLTKALQTNFDGVKDLFMKDYLADNTTNSGIIPKLKTVLKKNFMDFDSVFNKKASTSGVYALTNEMTKQITDKKNLIYDMNKALTTRESNLYSKYSKLEQALSEAQSQQSSMSAWFGSK